MEENKTTPPSPTAAPAPRRSGGLYAKIKDIYGKLYEANKDLMHEL